MNLLMYDTHIHPNNPTFETILQTAAHIQNETIKNAHHKNFQTVPINQALLHLGIYIYTACT
jgi:hypothetical protein